MSQNPRTTVQYSNANNQRVAKRVDGEIVEKYLWANLTTLLAIYDKDDNLIQRFDYVNSRMPISMTMNNQKYYLHYDQVGSLRGISRVLSPDNTNLEIVKEITYDTFGNILSDTNTSLKVPFGFAGGLYDSDTKLTRFGYRDYDAYTGKWTAKDPIGFAGGDSNLYGYVLGDPVGGVDEDGLKRKKQKKGRCSKAVYKLLKQMVDTKCKKESRSCAEGKCPDDCDKLRQNRYKNTDCAMARKIMNNTCFSGGDKGHGHAESEAWRAREKCNERMNNLGCPYTPWGF